MLHGLPFQCNSTGLKLNDTSTDITIKNNTATNSVMIEEVQPSASVSTTLYNTTNAAQILLSTAIVIVQDCYGNDHLCRAILDNRSQINILPMKMVRHLTLSYDFFTNLWGK